MFVSSLIAATGAAYAVGVARLWRNAGVGQGVARRQAIAFAGGWLALVAALLSPLDELAEQLFTAHMAQHELLMVVGAPLIALASPLVAMLWVLPRGGRRRAMRVMRGRRVSLFWAALTAPATVWLLHGLALWIWHMPALYDAALQSETVHAIQHLCFFGSASLFWWGIAHGRYGRAGYGVGVFYVFATAIHTGALGALLTFAPRVFYPLYAVRARHLHVNALEDQQLGGLLMWVPFGVVLVVAGLAMFLAWLGESERRTRLAEGAAAAPSRRSGAGWTAAFLVLAAAALTSCSREQEKHDAERLTGGRVARAPNLIDHYGCGSCHSIPGVPGATGTVGPPMDHIASRSYIAGRLPNEPTAMITWLRSPQHFEPATAMPNMGVSESDARDIAAYLYTLR